MCWYSWQFSSLFCHHPLTMGSISFRQGQKALACRLAHCVALSNDVAWKKPIRHYCTYDATSLSNQHWLDLFSSWWWWRQDHDDETKLAHLTHSAAPLPQNTRQQIRERPKTADWACSAIVLYLLFRFVRFWTEYMYQLVSFFSGTMHVKLSCCLTNILKTIYQHRRCSYKTVDLWWPFHPSIHPSIHPSHPLFALHQPERHKMKNQDNLQRTKMNGDELKSHLVHTNCQ